MLRLAGLTALCLVASACSAPPETTAAAVAADFPVELGQGTAHRTYASYPVTVDNRSGREIRFLKVSCAFYDKQNALIDTGLAGFVDVPIGARSAGRISIEHKNSDHFECSASPTY